MSYVRDKLLQRATSRRFTVALFFVCPLLWVDFSLADDWSCTPPPNDATKAVIDKYPGQYELLPRNDHIVSIVEGALERRLRFTSKLVSCRGGYCRISEEFINFIGKKSIYMPEDKIKISICSSHNSGCGIDHCVGEYTENYDVIYAWEDGSIRLRLDISSKNDNLMIDRIEEYNFALDPDYRDYYARFIGASKNSRLFIGISRFYVNETK